MEPTASLTAELLPGPKPHTVDVTFGDACALRLSEAALRRLHSMWRESAGVTEDTATDPHPRFLSDLCALLLRYQSLDGGGFQCAIGSQVFGCLRTHWGVEFEAFASPLNAHFGVGHYCSAFPDTDAPFGSLGSFWAISAAKGGNAGRTPLVGSYQLNPPFSLELYTALAARCTELLDQAEAADASLCLVLIFGATDAANQHAGVRALRASAYLRGELTVGVAEHVYVCGRQHMQAESRTFRACDTAVLMLQTAASARQWPTTPPKLATLSAAFRASNVTKANGKES